MKWRNVRLIFSRELRDQLRDRRTLFTVAVMPMLLYPLMGMALLQVGQFMRQYPTKVWLINTHHLPTEPALIADQQLNPKFIKPGEAELLEISYSESGDAEFRDVVAEYQKLILLEHGAPLADQLIQRALAKRSVDIAVYFPAPIEIPTLAGIDATTVSRDPTSEIANAYLFLNSAKDQSRIGAERVNGVLLRWQSAFVAEVMTANNLPSD